MLKDKVAIVTGAASGIGLSKTQQLLRIQLPLALPFIMAGIRISAVTAVGTVTIAAFAGAGGLGWMINIGLNANDANLLALLRIAEPKVAAVDGSSRVGQGDERKRDQPAPSSRPLQGRGQRVFQEQQVPRRHQGRWCCSFVLIPSTRRLLIA